MKYIPYFPVPIVPGMISASSLQILALPCFVGSDGFP